MLSRYERIVESYKIWYPTFYEKTVDCKPVGQTCILVTLKDGCKMEYDSYDNSIRDVTNLYVRAKTDGVDEEMWRKEFGRKLYKAIITNGITNERLSDITGISRQMLSRYIRGHSTPSGYILSRLSEALNCDVRELTKLGFNEE